MRAEPSRIARSEAVTALVGREMVPPILTSINVYARHSPARAVGDRGRSSCVRMGSRTYRDVAAFDAAVVRRIRGGDFARCHADRGRGRAWRARPALAPRAICGA